MCSVFRRILLILFSFACIKLGYIYAQHHKSYAASFDRIRRENRKWRFFRRGIRVAVCDPPSNKRPARAGEAQLISGKRKDEKIMNIL